MKNEPNHLKRETEYLIIVAQGKCMRLNYIQAKISKFKSKIVAATSAENELKLL